MTDVEKDYKEVVDDFGYKLASRTADLLFTEKEQQKRFLYFSILTNAFWRGKNTGIEEARVLLQETKRKQAESGKSIN